MSPFNISGLGLRHEHSPDLSCGQYRITPETGSNLNAAINIFSSSSAAMPSDTCASAIPGWFEAAGNRTTTNTEYMNYFGHPNTQWAGVDDERADQIAVAQIGAEHTEAMRRARVDGIWPYMYAGWTRTRLAARVREQGTGGAVW